MNGMKGKKITMFGLEMMNKPKYLKLTKSQEMVIPIVLTHPTKVQMTCTWFGKTAEKNG
jgi:hypothetical protein